MVEWHITNQTADTLLLRVGYRLDSVPVDPADLPMKRLAQATDSMLQRHVGQRFPDFPLDHLVNYRGRWYWVRNAYATADPYWSDAAGYLHAAAVNRTTGVITYKLVPGGGHQLAAQACLPCDTLPPTLPPLASLHLSQGPVQRTLPTGKELNQLFQREGCSWREWLNWGRPATFRYEIHVRPDLKLND